MTKKLKPTIDSLAAYMITDLALEARRDPASFLRTIDEVGGPRFAELLIVDEFDVPDDLYWLYDITENDDPRLDDLFALRDKVQLHTLIFDAVGRLTKELT